MGTIKSFKKFIEESIWSDMQDRSAGDTVRKEDEITTNKDLRNKILGLYKEQGEGETLDVSSLTNCIKCDDFSYIFEDFHKVKHIIGLEDWDVSNIKDMKGMFRNCEKFNSDLSKWDVSSVENMGFMFQGCKKFKSDLSNWDVSNVKDMYNMFCYCENFNCDLSNWDVSSVGDMCRMFDSCINFNSDLSNWDVSNVKDMNCMFDVCVNFNSDLSNWDVSNVKDMYYMFAGCINFNSDLSNWDVSNVEDMHGMFEDCENFNSDLSKWNVSKVEDMESIFNGCDSLKNKPSWYHISESFIKNHFGFLNESIWSDMQDRSAGDTVRKEDERHKILERLLATYIKLFAESCYYHDEYAYSSYPDFISYIKDFRDNPRIEEVCPNDSYFDDLLDYVNKETWDNQIFDTIVEISLRIVHGEHPITDDVIEELRKHNVNESIWSDMQDRSAGVIKRKEDDVNLLDYDDLYDYIKSKYSGKLFYIDKDYFGQGGETICVDPIENVSLFLKRLKDGSLEHILLSWASVDIDDSFLLKLEERFFVSSPNVKRRIIKEKDGTCTNQTYIDVIDFFLENIDNIVVNESIWSDMQDRSSGDVVRKEDEMNDYDFLMLRKTAEMFRNFMKRNRYASRRNTCDNFIKYIERRKEEHFWTNVSDEAYDKVIRFVQKNWGDCTGIQEFMDKYLSNINECDGVPGGLTPADVGGMGPAYFPGPNGEPGSGDLPSPTGIVYKQVAPFDSFIKIRKQKKKKKKFRKEDEPCAKYDNHPVCKHIDDFRDYVDRVYNQIDRKK